MILVLSKMSIKDKWRGQYLCLVTLIMVVLRQIEESRHLACFDQYISMIWDPIDINIDGNSSIIYFHVPWVCSENT